MYSKDENRVTAALIHIIRLCGVFVQVVLAKIEELGADFEISKDFKSFASCIKEGVLNYDMLMAKYNNKWMRVECHQKYGKLIYTLSLIQRSSARL